MNQQIATVAENSAYTSAQVNLIRRTVAADCTTDELALFLEVCRTTGLNPIFRQIYAIVRSKDDPKFRSMTIQTGIDGYRLLAARTGALAGIDDALYDSEEREHPTWASVTVWRIVQGQRVPFSARARWSEYAALTREGKPMSMWAKMPFLMLGKCAEALALRKAFPAELSGVYTAEEMAQADNPAPAAYIEASSTPPPPVSRASRTPAAPSAVRGGPTEWMTDTGYNPLADVALRKRLAALGIGTVDLVERELASVRERGEYTREAILDHVARLETAEAAQAPADDLTDLPVGVRGN